MSWVAAPLNQVSQGGPWGILEPPFPYPPTQSPLPWTDLNISPSATGQENRAASPITEFISLVGLSETENLLPHSL